MTSPQPTPDLQAFVPRLVRRWLLDEPDRTHHELEGTLLFADVSGFTALSERLTDHGRQGSEILVQLIGECFDGMIEAAERHGGDVLTFGGDALLVLFEGDGHAHRAVAGACGMRAHVQVPRDLPIGETAELRVSQGVHTGTFTAYLAGSAQRELVLVGPDVTRVLETEGEAEAGEILLTDACSASVPETSLTLGPPRGDWRAVAAITPPASATVPTVTDDKLADDLTVVLPPAEREVIASGFAGEHRRITAAFVAMGGTDGVLRRAGPTDLGRRIDRVSAAIESAAARFGVHWLECDVAKDGIKFYVVAGAPTTGGDDEDRMVAFAKAVMREAGDPDLTIGMNHGTAFSGIVGAISRAALVVMGDPVNLAARLVARAEAGQIIATKSLLAQLRTPVASEPLVPFTVKGKQAPIEASLLLDDARRQVGDDGRLLGREADTSRLSALLDRENASDPLPCIELVGPVGIGKSRLLRELRPVAPAFAVISTQVDPYERDRPFAAVVPLLRRIAGIEPDDDSGVAGTRLLAWATAVAPSACDLLPTAAAMFGAHVAGTAASQAIDPQFRAATAQHLVAELLDQALESPTLLVVDDLHLADDASRQVIASLAHPKPGRPWTVITAAVGDASTPSLLPDSSVRHVVQPLGPEAAEQLVAHALDRHEVPTDALGAIVRAGSGSPLFLLELAGSLASGELESTDDLPGTVEQVVTARIDALPAEERSLLRQAAVFGQRIDLRLIDDVLGHDAATRLTSERLEKFLERTGPKALHFRLGVHRDVAYEGLPFNVRTPLHGSIADAMVRRLADEPGATGAIALHFQHANRHEDAWRWLLMAAKEADASGSSGVAADLYEAATAAGTMVPSISAGEMTAVICTLGEVATRAARYEVADRAWARALEAEVVRDDPIERARLLRARGVVADRTSDFDRGAEYFAESIAALGPPPWDIDVVEQAAETHIAWASLLFHMGQLESSIEHTTAAIDLVRDHPLPATLAYAAFGRGAVRQLAGQNPYDDLEAAISLYEQLEDKVGLANAMISVGALAWREGQWADALDCYERALASATTTGDRLCATRARYNIADIRLQQGQMDVAQVLFTEVHSDYLAAGHRWDAAATMEPLSRIAARAGDLATAYQLLDEAERKLGDLGATSWLQDTQVRRIEYAVLEDNPGMAREIADRLLPSWDELDVVNRAGVTRLLGWAARLEGQLEVALQQFEGSMATARLDDAKYPLLLARRGRAMVLRELGRPDEVEEQRLKDDMATMSIVQPPL